MSIEQKIKIFKKDNLGVVNCLSEKFIEKYRAIPCIITMAHKWHFLYLYCKLLKKTIIIKFEQCNITFGWFLWQPEAC